MSDKKMPIELYGLLHLSSEESSTENSHIKNFQDQISVYLDCAINLSKSLKSREILFVLLTNKKEYLNKILQQKNETLSLKEIPFKTKVPHETKFYSAHFKLDAFRYLSSLNSDYVGLCDLDMICINEMPNSFINNSKQKIPMCYDLSDQVIPAYGSEVIMQSLNKIHRHESEGRWSGGEFITGAPDFFKLLSSEIDKLFDSYLSNIDQLHHIGDEAITSAALEMIRLKGVYIADAGTLGIVGRYWSAKCLHPQKPFEYFQNCFILHLPADKRFLSTLSKEKEIHLSVFNRRYKKYRKLLHSNANLKRIVKIILKNTPVAERLIS